MEKGRNREELYERFVTDKREIFSSTSRFWLCAVYKSPNLVLELLYSSCSGTRDTGIWSFRKIPTISEQIITVLVRLISEHFKQWRYFRAFFALKPVHVWLLSEHFFCINTRTCTTDLRAAHAVKILPTIF